MCWIGPELLHHAEKDISVFKIVRINRFSKIIKSYYELFEYHIGESYKSNFEIIYLPERIIEITEGLHSYDVRCKVRIGRNGMIVDLPYPKYYEIPFFISDDIAILHCVIPKGSLYYVNSNGEYVSNYLRTIKLGYVLAK